MIDIAQQTSIFQFQIIQIEDFNIHKL